MTESGGSTQAPSSIQHTIGDGMQQLDEAVVDADVLLTGFPGFLAENLLVRLVELQPDSMFYLLIQSQYRRRARRRLDRIEEAHPDFEGRWELIDGDITDGQLGVDDQQYQQLTESVATVWHLAAIYDLAVAEQLAYRVNVTGTIHVLDFCEAAADLERFNYISTCYVSGQRQGTIFEDELDEGQGHNNHYESTKFWAEVEVQRRAGDIPTAIFRPGIVVGDSDTGETAKYDGPYYLMKLLNRLPNWLPMVNVGKGETVVNVVPIDFVVDALAYLGLAQDTAGGVFHLADAHPMRARDVVALMLDCMDKAPAVASVPSTLVEAALQQRRLEQMVGVPHQALVYFNHDARYDTSHTQRALAPTSIRCPHLSTYMQTLVDYFLRHPQKGFMDKRSV